MIEEPSATIFKMRFWNNLIRGKSIALVGGSDEINWGRVNGCDLVARVNAHWERQRGACDILYFSCGDDLSIDMLDDDELYQSLKFAWINASNMLFNGAQQMAKFALVCDLLKKRNVKMALYATAPARAFEVFDCLKDLPERFWWTRELAEKWSFHPLTGMAALYHLGKSEAGSVYVDGMSFYKGERGADSDQVPITAGTHDIPSQIRFLREFTAKNGKIALCPALESVVDHDPSYRIV